VYVHEGITCGEFNDILLSESHFILVSDLGRSGSISVKLDKGIGTSYCLETLSQYWFTTVIWQSFPKWFNSEDTTFIQI